MSTRKPKVRHDLPCRKCPARPVGLCQPMTDESDLAALEAARHVTYVPAGTTIYRQGDLLGHVFNIISGWAHLYQLLDDGRRQVLHFALPGAVLGAGVDVRGVASHSVQCLTDVLLCRIAVSDLALLRQRNARFGERHFWLLLRDEELAYDHITNIGQRSATERLAHLLLELACRSQARYPLAGGESIYMPLTQVLIGDAIGLTGVHVNRTLRKLRDQNIIDVHNSTLRILDPDALVKLAGLGNEVLQQWISRDSPAMHRTLGQRQPVERPGNVPARA